MDPIKQALTDELDSKTLSTQKKQAILQHKQPKRTMWLPKFVAVCVVAIALFLAVSANIKQPEYPASANAPLGPVDAAIIDYFNKQVTRGQSDLYDGDAYLLRLALEKNSRMFYEDSELPVAKRLEISELLHYVQEASWQGINFSLQPVTSVEELVTLAPKVIAELKPQVALPYLSVADEKKHQWEFYSYDKKAWINYVIVSVLLLAAIVKLVRDKHWIITACCVFIIVVVAYQPFSKPYQDVAAYDEYSLIEVVTNQLQKMDVKVTGEPVLQYAATMHQTRSALVAFDDYKVLATFTYKNGQYVEETMMWHTDKLFREIALDTLENSQQQTVVFGFADDHQVARLRLEGDTRSAQAIDITPKEPMIIFYKKPQELTGFSVWYLNERGQQVQ